MEVKNTKRNCTCVAKQFYEQFKPEIDKILKDIEPPKVLPKKHKIHKYKPHVRKVYSHVKKFSKTKYKLEEFDPSGAAIFHLPRIFGDEDLSPRSSQRLQILPGYKNIADQVVKIPLAKESGMKDFPKLSELQEIYKRYGPEGIIKLTGESNSPEVQKLLKVLDDISDYNILPRKKNIPDQVIKIPLAKDSGMKDFPKLSELQKIHKKYGAEGILKLFEKSNLSEIQELLNMLEDISDCNILPRKKNIPDQVIKIPLAKDSGMKDFPKLSELQKIHKKYGAEGILKLFENSNLSEIQELLNMLEDISDCNILPRKKNIPDQVIKIPLAKDSGMKSFPRLSELQKIHKENGVEGILKLTGKSDISEIQDLLQMLDEISNYKIKTLKKHVSGRKPRYSDRDDSSDDTDSSGSGSLKEFGHHKKPGSPKPPDFTKVTKKTDGRGKGGHRGKTTPKKSDETKTIQDIFKLLDKRGEVRSIGLPKLQIKQITSSTSENFKNLLPDIAGTEIDKTKISIAKKKKYTQEELKKQGLTDEEIKEVLEVQNAVEDVIEEFDIDRKPTIKRRTKCHFTFDLDVDDILDDDDDVDELIILRRRKLQMSKKTQEIKSLISPQSISTIAERPEVTKITSADYEERIEQFDYKETVLEPDKSKKISKTKKVSKKSEPEEKIDKAKKESDKTFEPFPLTKEEFSSIIVKKYGPIDQVMKNKLYAQYIDQYNRGEILTGSGGSIAATPPVKGKLKKRVVDIKEPERTPSKQALFSNLKKLIPIKTIVDKHVKKVDSIVILPDITKKEQIELESKHHKLLDMKKKLVHQLKKRTQKVTKVTAKERRKSVKDEEVASVNSEDLVKLAEKVKRYEEALNDKLDMLFDAELERQSIDSEIDVFLNEKGYITTKKPEKDTSRKPQRALQSDTFITRDEFYIPEMASIGLATESRALAYLKYHRIPDLFHFLGAHLVASCPENPIEFLITLLECCILHRNGYCGPPYLFEKLHIESLFNSMDPFNIGHITLEQYHIGMRTMNIPNYNESPKLFKNEFVLKNEFIQEALKYQKFFIDEITQGTTTGSSQESDNDYCMCMTDFAPEG